MISTVGQHCLLLAILVNLVILIFNLSHRTSSKIVILSFFLLTISFSSLIYSYIILDSSLITVSKLVNRYLPIFYRVGSSWGNHEGSMLLWCYIISCYQLYSNIKFTLTKNETSHSNRITSLILAVFCIYTYISSNPFLITYNGFMVDKELNPVLQDPILIIHPPIIYIGYLGSILIYSYILYSFKEINIDLLRYIKKVAVFSWSLLTLGILLGSWWAYHELGWGGWWFWDPVENVSLLPWIFLLLVIHNISYAIKHNQVTSHLYIFGTLTFISSCYGTFFVRSGLITSIHSFASDSSRGIIILVSLLIFASIFVYNYYYRKVSYNNLDNYVIYIYNILMMCILFVILLGTVFPSIYLFLIGKEISIGASFYNDIIVPWSLLFLTLMLIFGQKTWSLQSAIQSRAIIFILTSIGIYMYLIYAYIDIHIIYQIIIVLILSNLSYIIYSSISNRILKYRDFAHFGFNVTILGMVLSSNFEYEVIINGFPGENYQIGDYLVIIKDINIYQNTSYYSLYTNILLDNGDQIVSCMPEKRLYLSNLNVISKSIISSNYLNDMYYLIGDGNDITGWYFRVYISYSINLIWIGGLITLIGYIIK